MHRLLLWRSRPDETKPVTILGAWRKLIAGLHDMMYEVSTSVSYQDEYLTFADLHLRLFILSRPADDPICTRFIPSWDQLNIDRFTPTLDNNICTRTLQLVRTVISIEDSDYVTFKLQRWRRINQAIALENGWPVPDPEPPHPTQKAKGRARAEGWQRSRETQARSVSSFSALTHAFEP